MSQLDVSAEDDTSQSSTASSSSSASSCRWDEGRRARPTGFAPPTRKRRLPLAPTLSRINLNGLGGGQTPTPKASADPAASCKAQRASPAASRTSSTTSLHTMGLASPSGSEDESTPTPNLQQQQQQQTQTNLPTPTDDNNAPPGHLDKRIRLSSSSSTGAHAALDVPIGSGAPGRANSVSPAPEPACYDFADLEGSQSGAQRSNPFVKEQIIGGGEYELVGDGKECKAVHLKRRTIHHCRVLNLTEYRAYMQVAERLELAAAKLRPAEMDEFRRMLIPEETEVVRGECGRLFYVISPDHGCNLQTLFAMRAEELKLSEPQSRSVFAQVVRLAHYCQQVGIYFRDFLLKKIVFVEKDSFSVRFMFSTQDLFVVAAGAASDEVQLQKGCCPAYTAPEMIPAPNSKHHTYRAGPANVWSLAVLLHTLLTGRAPFMARSPKDLFKLIRAARLSFAPRDRLSPAAKCLLHALFRAQPAERPTPADLLACEWLRDEPAPARGGGAAPPARPDAPLAFSVALRPQAADLPPAVAQLLAQPPPQRDAAYAHSPELRLNVQAVLRRHLDQASFRPVPEQVVPSLEQPDLVPDVLGVCALR